MSHNLKIADNVRLKNVLINFSVLLIILITSFFVASAIIKKVLFYDLASDNAIIIENSEIIGESRDFSYYLKESGEEIVSEFTAYISKSDIDKIDEDYVTLFTPMMQCEAFCIYINGENVAIEGDIVEYNSSLWTMHYYYTLDSDIFYEEINELKIVQYGRYMSGGLGSRFLIDGYQASIYLRNLQLFDMHPAIFGIAALMLILVALMVFIIKNKRTMYILMLITLACMMTGYIEFFKINKLFLDYLLFKKILVTANLMSVGFGTLFVRTMYNRSARNSKLFIICYSFFVFIPTFFACDMPTFKSLYTIMTYIMVPVLIYWGYLSVKNYNNYTRSKIILALTITTIAYILIWNILENTIGTYTDPVTVVIMPSFVVVMLALILLDMHGLKVDAEDSSKKLSKAYKQSIIDGLTQLYNSDYMIEVVKSMDPPYTFVIFDIDEYKSINDTYGHLAGDEALRQVSKIVVSMLRAGDVLSRYGGDEFTIIIREIVPERTESILERIRKEVESSTFLSEGQTFKFTVSMGYYIVEEKQDYKKLVSCADKALYAAKKLGRNRVIRYQKEVDE